MAREILIIRHGETASNAARIVQTPDIPLSDRGLAQARQLGRRLRALGIEHILSSDQTRAHMTAEEVRSATGVPLSLEPLLQERNFGEIRGTPYAELGGVDIFAHDYEPPGGETGAVFEARVDDAWQSIRVAAQRTPGRLAVITHGLVCASLTARHLTTEGEAVAGSWRNTSVTVVEGRAPWRVTLLNCTSHLDEDTPDGAAV